VVACFGGLLSKAMVGAAPEDFGDPPRPGGEARVGVLQLVDGGGLQRGRWHDFLAQGVIERKTYIATAVSMRSKDSSTNSISKIAPSNEDFIRI
jgi:hypothetical protein